MANTPATFKKSDINRLIDTLEGRGKTLHGVVMRQGEVVLLFEPVHVSTPIDLEEQTIDPDAPKEWPTDGG